MAAPEFDRQLIAPRYAYLSEAIVRLAEPAASERYEVLRKIAEGVYQRHGRQCRLCDSGHFSILAERDRYGFPIVTAICKFCGLVQTNPDFRHQDYVDFYRQHYRKLYIAELVGEPKDFFQEEIWRGQSIMRFLSKHIRLGKDALVLEVGCGAGGILDALRERGFRVIGTDYGVENLAYGRSRGLDLRDGDLFSLELVEKPTLIVYSHVLEHVYDPNRELQKVREILAPDGYLYVEVPGIRAVRTNVFQGDFLRTFHMAHIYNFTLTTLSRLLGKNGFQLIAGDEHVRSIFRKGTQLVDSSHDYARTIAYMRVTERFRGVYGTVFRVRMYVKGLWQRAVVIGVRALKRIGLYSRARSVWKRIA
jgi:SAM-dependent methyltransferase